jgi:hypothetical protein
VQEGKSVKKSLSQLGYDAMPITSFLRFSNCKSSKEKIFIVKIRCELYMIVFIFSIYAYCAEMYYYYFFVKYLYIFKYEFLDSIWMLNVRAS